MLSKLFCKHRFVFVTNLNFQGQISVEGVCDLCEEKSHLEIVVYEEPSVKRRKFVGEMHLCNKRTYKSKKDALTVLNACRKLRRSRRPQRVYECNTCTGWHLTSKDFRY